MDRRRAHGAPAIGRKPLHSGT